MRVEPRALGLEGSLGADYAAGVSRARGLFPPEALGLDLTDPRPAGAVARLPAEALGCTSPTARRKLERILGGEGVLVSTGQQPGLFLGPLYVLHKTLTAIELARRIEETSGIPALALFWVASDDHDWDEVAVTRLLDRDGSVAEIRLAPPPGRERRAVGSSPLPPEVRAALERLRELLPASEFVERYLGLLESTYLPGRSFGEAFAEALSGALKGRDFAWIEATADAVKEASLPFFEDVLVGHDSFERAVEAGTEAVQAAGYHPQLKHLPGASLLFFDTGEERARLYVRGEEARPGREGAPTTLEQIRAWLLDDPGRFSPAAALRPALESWLLPVAATVLGPGEIAYWAQLGGVFARAGRPMPAVQPRFGWTVLESRVARLMEEIDATEADFSDGGGSLGQKVVARERPEALDTAIGGLRESLGAGLDRVEDAVKLELPGIRSAVGKARKSAFDAVGGLERAIDHRIRERKETLLERIGRAATQLFPGGKPQERVLSPFQYLSRYGDAFPEEIERAGRSRSLSIITDVAGVAEQE